MKLEDVILRGTRSDQPDATDVPEGSLYYVTDESVIERSNGTTWDTYSSSGGLICIQRITATGAYVYTPTTGTVFIIVELQGAGGGGGGVASPGGTDCALAGGGQGGGWLRKLISDSALFSGATGSVGAGGAGGAAGNNAGAAGGNTTFVDTAATTYTAGGGDPGAGTAGLGPTPKLRVPARAGGVCTNGDDSQSGWPGSTALALGTAQALGAFGGNSKYGQGGYQSSIGAINTSLAGGNALGKGAGGGGAAALGTGVAAAGGNGSDGIVIIWEFQ